MGEVVVVQEKLLRVLSDLGVVVGIVIHVLSDLIPAGGDCRSGQGF